MVTRFGRQGDLRGVGVPQRGQRLLQVSVGVRLGDRVVPAVRGLVVLPSFGGVGKVNGMIVFRLGDCFTAGLFAIFQFDLVDAVDMELRHGSRGIDRQGLFSRGDGDLELAGVASGLRAAGTIESGECRLVCLRRPDGAECEGLVFGVDRQGERLVRLSAGDVSDPACDGQLVRQHTIGGGLGGSGIGPVILLGVSPIMRGFPNQFSLVTSV